MNRMSLQFVEGKSVYRREGVVSLVTRGVRLLTGYFFKYETSYLFAYATRDVENVSEADFMPRIDGFAFRLVSTTDEADDLEAEGIESGSWPPGYREKLEKGAIAGCVFVGRELAHIVWIGLSEEAKAALQQPPYEVDFANNECCRAGGWTHPKYRGNGFARYAYFRTNRFLHDRGVAMSRGAIVATNRASLTTYERCSPRMYGQLRHTRLLWWQSWKVESLNSDVIASAAKQSLL